MADPTDDVALALGGGGARSAYQVGVMRAIARRFPEFEAPILTGVSAGAINTAHIANHTGTPVEKMDDLANLWSSLDVAKVFESRGAVLFWRALRVGLRLSIGFPRGGKKPIHGMVDTTPLRATLTQALSPKDGKLHGVESNLIAKRLKAVALVTTRYSTGQTVTFYAGGGDISGWERPQRRSVRTELSIDHVMASAALPLFFPPVPVGDAYFGDGGVRLVAPLAPALHLGANRILAISTRYRRTGSEADQPAFQGAPSPAQIMGVMFSAIFLDQLDQDALHLERINHFVRTAPPEKRIGLREVGLLVLRPSRDLGKLANDFEPRLPGMFRYLTRRLGTKQSRSQDFLSTVMFQPDYVRVLMELGEEDGEARADEIGAFLAGEPATREVLRS